MTTVKFRKKNKRVYVVNIVMYVVLITCIVYTNPLVASQQAAVATAHPLATEAAIEIFNKGGNAFDAAIAITAVLAVVEPYSSGIGGGGFWLLHLADENRDIMIDGRERAPMAATRDMYLDQNGDVIHNASIDGPLSAGIPGVPAAIVHLAENYGVLPLSITLSAAIYHAENGYVVNKLYKRLAGFRKEVLLKSDDASKIFLNNFSVPNVGEKIIQQDLANTLRGIAKDKNKGFYQGVIATKLVNSVKKNGGIWTLKDLADYRIIERKPVTGQYRGMKITSVPPPSSGGVALIEILNILSSYDIENKNNISRTHLIIEAMRSAYRDRAEYLGDTDFICVPVQKLISSDYANELQKNIKLNSATASEDLKPVLVDSVKGTDTTHFSVIDQDGNRVAATLSINYPFGSGFVAKGTGVLLNDEMDDFSAKPGEPNIYGLVGADANAIEPGKRMLSSMTPTFLETKDRIAVLGTPGGSRIITMVLLATLDFYEGASAQHMVDLKRFHHQYLPDKVFYEPETFSKKILNKLFKLGHDTEAVQTPYGNMHVVIINKKTKKLDAASDKRGIGKAKVI